MLEIEGLRSELEIEKRAYIQKMVTLSRAVQEISDLRASHDAIRDAELKETKELAEQKEMRRLFTAGDLSKAYMQIEELLASHGAIRDATLEEAAEVCDNNVWALDHGGNKYIREATASNCAALIRALKSSQPSQDKP